MAYNNVTDAGDLGNSKLIPEQVAGEILTNLPAQSAALSLFRKVALSSRSFRQPVLTALPMAYFVNGDTGMKQTTEMAWDGKVMTVEEIAVLMPVPNNVIDDLSFDIWGTARPLIEEAVGRTLDAAVFFGVGKPASWPDSVVAAAIAAGNVVARGTNAAAAGGLAGDVDDLMSVIESDGYDVNGFVSARTLRGRLRKLRDSTGNRLLDVDVTGNSINGIPVNYSMEGLWPSGASAAELIAGDFTRGILGTRKDITYEIFTEGVIQDPADGHIVYNLLQQDMSAMRVTARFAWQTANPINYSRPDEAARNPFGVLTAPAT